VRERDIDVAKLRKQLSYDASTGALVWRCAKGRQPAGAPAGVRLPTGYLAIRFDGVRHPAHRLAWLIAHGAPADGEIDHKDGDRTNNRLSNLRAVPRCVNQQNQRRAQCTNKTGLLGVSKSDGPGFRARIFYAGKENHLGTFKTPEDAHAAYLAAKRHLHEGCTI
jgi:hypothetical protein